MTSWIQLLRSPELIESLYETPPSLVDFQLSEIGFDASENACTLRGTLSEFPDFARPGWEDDANCAGIRWQLEGIDEFDLQGWSFENIVDLSIESLGRPQPLEVTAEGDPLTLRVVCNSVHVANVFAYHSVGAGEAKAN